MKLSVNIKNVLGATCLLLLGLSLNATAEVRSPHGIFYKDIEDLKVKVMGGHITPNRTWYQDRWHFNWTWEPLLLELPADAAGGGSVTRTDTTYATPSVSRQPITLDGQPGYHLEVTYTSTERSDDWIIRSGDIPGSATDSAAERQVPNLRWESKNGRWAAYRLDDGGVTAHIESYGDRTGPIASFSYDTEGRLTGVKDRFDTQVLWYDYDTESQLQYIRDAESHQVEYRYTGGQLSEVIDVRGNSWAYTYTDNRLATLTDPELRTTEIAYGNAKRVSQVTLRDNQGNRLETRYVFDYDKTKKEYYVQIKDPTGSVSESWYNSGSLLIRKAVNGVETYAMTKDSGGVRETRIKTDRRGLKTTTEYDEWNNLTKTTYPDGSTTRAKYKPGTDLVTERTDELGRITKYEYDANGHLIKLTEALGTPVERIIEYAYNADGLRIEQKILADADSEQALTSYDYDPQGNLKTLTDPENNVTRFTYTLRGDLLTRTDPNTKTWVNTYDPAGNLKTQADPLDHTVILDYDKVGNLISRENAKHHTSTYTYNLQNKRISQTDPLTHKTELGYDGAGRLTSIKDPLNNVQKIGYDLQGRLISLEDPAGNVTTLGYGEGAGQGGGLDGNTNYPGLLNRTQYPTYLQTYDYDKRDRRTRSIDHLDAGAAITVTEYYANGNKRSTLDAELRKTEYRYDELDRLSEIIDPAQQHTYFKYDNRDNLIAVTDPNSHTTRYTYDKADRKKSEILPGGQTTQYDFDPAGNLTTTMDPDGRKTVNHYDGAGRLEWQDHFAIGASTPERTVTYGYDDNDNLTSWGDGTLSATYGYDENNRKTSESTDYGAFSLGHSYTYDAAGNKKTFTGPDNVIITYHWDKGRLSRIEIPNEGSIYYNSYKWSQPDKITWPGGATREVTYDGDLKPKRILDLDPGENPTLDYQYTYDKTGNIEQKATQNLTYNYAYDLLQRLTEAKSEVETEGWEYDPNGNRTSDNLNPGTWDYDVNDRLKESPGVTYGYDAAGNTTSKTEGGVTTTYLYNGEGRLNRIEDATQALIGEYRYDPMGRRIKKTTQSETLYFDYSDEGLVGEYDANGNVARQYGYAPESTWTTDPLYQKTGQGYAYYRNDHLGTPQQLAAKNGAKVWNGEYLAFGKVRDQTGTWDNRLRFAGQYYDSETGNFYNYYRDYDPNAGRYLQSDPIGLNGGINTYAYVSADPINSIDPLGLVKKPKLGQEYRPCDDNDWDACIVQCGSRGVKKCDRLWYFKPVRVTQPGLKLYDWVKGPLSCVCNEEPDDSSSLSCGDTCQKSMVWTFIAGVGWVLLNICTLGAAGS